LSEFNCLSVNTVTSKYFTPYPKD